MGFIYKELFSLKSIPVIMHNQHKPGKPMPVLLRTILILQLVMASLILSACGNRGGLYLPESQEIAHHKTPPMPASAQKKGHNEQTN